jgi:hypothetical protein
LLVFFTNNQFIAIVGVPHQQSGLEQANEKELS